MNELMTVEEVAEATRVAPGTLRWMRQMGDRGPKSFKLGRRVFYKRTDVSAWLDEQYESTKAGAR